MLELREQTLDERALQLERSKAELEKARQQHSLESERLLAAARRRNALADGRTDVASWAEAEQWLTQRQAELRRANAGVTNAEATVNEALQGVVDARIDKRRIELLDQHLAQAELRKENQQEQRLTDELARRRRSRDGDGGKS